MKEKLKAFLNTLNPAGVVYWSAIAILVVIVIGLISTVLTMDDTSELDIPTEYKHVVYLVVQDKPKTETPEVTDEPEAEATGYQYTEEEINMIAQLTMAEAGNQSELGKRLVIDTVLNRVDHEAFPNTVRDVIYQKNQFSPISDGRFEKCYPTDENIQLVKEEIERRTDHDVVFFRAGRYGDYGVPMYCVGDHYFSSYAHLI